MPTPEPTSEPTAEPTPEPTAEPTPEPTAEPTAEPTPEPTPVPKYAVTAVEGARLFGAADAALEPLAVLPQGIWLEVVEADAGWIVVQWDGEAAWLPAGEAVLTDELPEAEPPEATEEFGEETPAPSEAPEDEDGNGLILETGEMNFGEEP